MSPVSKPSLISSGGPLNFGGNLVMRVCRLGALYRFLTPRIDLAEKKPSAGKDIEWVEVRLFRKRLLIRAQGLRGIACILVVVFHVFETFAPYYHAPSISESVPPLLFQLPFLRLIPDGGHCDVMIFFVLSGLVISLKPLKLARSGRAQEARDVLASSAFRRGIRILLPACFVTALSWALCQLGAYRSVETFGSGWLERVTPKRDEHFWDSLKKLWMSCVPRPIIVASYV
jgi:Acyltransferase family